MIIKFKRILRFSFQELKAQFRIQTFLILNLALGIFGFLLLQIFQQSLLEQTRAKAQETMASDFSISARRILDNSEITKIETQFHFYKKLRPSLSLPWPQMGQKRV